MKQACTTPSAPDAVGPYSAAVEAGDWIYISGQIPIHPQTGALVQDGIEQEVTQVLDNLEAILADLQLSTDNVVKTTIYVTDMGDFQAINAIYATRFRAPFPARATVAVAALPKGAHVEIDAVVYRG